jgi:hypothetical protein
VAGRCTGGAAGIWAMHFFGHTYFDEITIFVLSKDQTFRIRSTFGNPEQFLILVTHLVKVKCYKMLKNVLKNLLDTHFERSPKKHHILFKSHDK